MKRVIEHAGSWLFQGLASRLIFFVFCATLLTSLVVTTVSMRSLQGFLREKIDHELPVALESAAERLDVWYGQRRLDVATFARSAVLGSRLEELGGDDEERAQVARREVRDYLRYVLERFPQYRALIVYEAEGRELLEVGERPPFSDALVGELLEVDGSRMSDIHRDGDERVQIASATIRDERGERAGSLHVLLRVESVDELLQSGNSGRAVFLVGPDGRLLTRAQGRSDPAVYGRPLPEWGALPWVEEYENAAGERVVGSAMRIRRFGWTLVAEASYADAFAPAVVAARKVLLINVATVLLFSAIALRSALSIVRPIQALSQAARSIADGETDVAIPESPSNDELGLLTRTFNRMAARLERNRRELQENRLKIEAANVRLRGQNEELQRMNEALEQLSITDGLTRLYNHRFFQENLTREIARAERSDETLSLILFDIDNFKQLNDRYGHAAGDQVLCEVARIMSGIVRESDVLARYGGEEFALMPGQTTLEGAVALAEKIRMSISENLMVIEDDGKPATVRVTVSVGVAAYRDDRRAFFNDADRALYRAKASGKDCVVVEYGEEAGTD